MPCSPSRSVQNQSLELLSHYRKSRSAPLRNRLVQINLGLVRKEVHRCVHDSNEGFDDLVQVGSLGLIKAIEGFDLQRGCAFSTFAMPHIRGEIRHYLRDKSTTVRIPRRWHDLQIQAAKAKRQLQASLSRPPTAQELADCLDISMEEWQQVRLSISNRSLLSLDTPVNKSELGVLSIGDLLPDSQYQSFQLAEEEWLQLQQALSQLEQNIRTAVESVFLHELSQKETARRLGVNPVTVARWVARGVRHLKKIMAPVAEV